jgi:hypothetical protein
VIGRPRFEESQQEGRRSRRPFSLTADVSVSGADESRCSFCLGRFFDDVIGRRQIPSSRVLHSTLRVPHVKSDEIGAVFARLLADSPRRAELSQDLCLPC